MKKKAIRMLALLMVLSSVLNMAALAVEGEDQAAPAEETVQTGETAPAPSAPAEPEAPETQPVPEAPEEPEVPETQEVPDEPKEDQAGEDAPEDADKPVEGEDVPAPETQKDAEDPDQELPEAEPQETDPADPVTGPTEVPESAEDEEDVDGEPTEQDHAEIGPVEEEPTEDESEEEEPSEDEIMLLAAEEDTPIAEETPQSAAVNNATELEDGEYVPVDTALYTSDKLTISCTKVTVKDGKALADIGFSSPNYTKLDADGRFFEPETGGEGVVFHNVPVTLNAQQKIWAYTTSMHGKWIDYDIAVVLTAEPVALNVTGAEAVELTYAVLTPKRNEKVLEFTLSGFDQVCLGYPEDAMAGLNVFSAGEGGKFAVSLTDRQEKDGFVLSFHNESDGWGKVFSFTLDREHGTMTAAAVQDAEKTELKVTNKLKDLGITDMALVIERPEKITLEVTFADTAAYDKAFLGYALEASGAADADTIAPGGKTFYIPLTKGMLEAPFVLAFHSAGGWTEGQFTIDMKGKTLTVDQVQERVTVLKVQNNTKMFKISDTATVTVNGETIRLKVSFDSDTFKKAYFGYATGTASVSPELSVEGRTVVFTLGKEDLTAPFQVSFWSEGSTSGPKWSSQRVFTIDMQGQTLTVDKTVQKLAVTNHTKMFAIDDVAWVFQSDDDAALKLVFTSASLDKAFVGYADDAAAAAEGSIILRSGNAFTIPLTAGQLGSPFVLSFHSAKNDNWPTERLFTLDLEAGTLTVDAAPAKEADPANPGTEQKPEDETPEPLNGTTAAVDNATALPDGIYAPEKFTFSGGSGRTTISCTEIMVKDGRAYATLVFSSANFTYVKANGQTYYTTKSGNTSVVSIPIRLNTNNRIIGMTTAMSAGHEVEYSIYAYITGALAEKDDTTKPEQKIPGLTYLSADKNEETDAWEVYRYEGGYEVINVTEVARYLIVPEGKETPAPLDEDIQVVQLPVSRVYVGTEETYELLTGLEIPAVDDLLVLTGFDAGEEGVTELSDPQELELAELLRQRCGMAILPYEYADARVNGHDPKDKDAIILDDLTDEKAQELKKIFDGLKELGIPAFVDASELEETDQAALEWLKLYGELFHCADQVEPIYKERSVALAHDAA